MFKLNFGIFSFEYSNFLLNFLKISCCFGTRTSKEKTNFVPLLNLELKLIYPPNNSTSYLEMTSPMPIPSVLMLFALSLMDPNNLNIFP